MKNVLQELIDFEKPGGKVRMIIRTDSESVAAESVTVQRVATGTREAVRDGPLSVDRVNAKDNAADFGTKMRKMEAMNRFMNQRSKTMSDIFATLRNQSSKGVWRDGPPGVVW